MKRRVLPIAVCAALLAAGLVLQHLEPELPCLLVCLAGYLLVGWRVLRKAGRNLLHGKLFDENFLMALATVGAFAVREYPEAVAVMLFYQIGELFEHMAVKRSRRSIKELMSICPDTARRKTDDGSEEVAPEDIAVGETILVYPGERIPLDGTVRSGNARLDTAALTGESVPRSVRTGSVVYSGCIDLDGVLEIEVQKPFAESTVSKILELVENAAAKKSRSESFISRFAAWYTPVVVVLAVLLAIVPPLVLHDSFREWIYRALNFLVVSCPCALVISIPLSFFGGIGGASKRGILVKGSNYLEALADVDTLVFDKTGTLTRGVFSVAAVHPQELGEHELLELAALAEHFSNHPISRSLKEAYDNEIDPARVKDVQELPGRGVRAEVDGHDVAVGNGRLMDDLGVSWHDCHLPGASVHVAVDGKYAGHIVISDAPKPGAKETISALKGLGVARCVMLTGDTEQVGSAVARELGLDEVHCQLLPADKVARVEQMLAGRGGKGKLAFVGDGVNDAPVLSRADVGVAMGALGSDAAIEAADVVLMDDDLARLTDAIGIARKTLRIVRENIVFALAVKAIVLILGALGLANMWMAVFADVGVSVIAILNAMRALRA